MGELIVYARYIKDGDIKDKFLFCEPLQTTIKADKVLRLVANFFEKHQIKWEKLKTLPPNRKNILSICMQVANFIRCRPIHHRLFKLFCEKMKSENQVLLFHTEVRWFSRGKILTRMAEVKDEIAIFLRKYQSNFADKFENEVFILSLSYLADIESFE